MDEPPVVQHWVLCRRARALAPARVNNPYHLKGVSYQYAVPVSIGMSLYDPKPVKQMCLFARFFGGNGPHEFEIDVIWHDHPDNTETPLEVFGPYTIHFRNGEPVRDYVFRLRNFPLFGTGRYEIQLRLLNEGLDEPLAREYFEVIQP